MIAPRFLPIGILAALLTALAAVPVARSGDPSRGNDREDAEIERLLALHHQESDAVRLVLIPAAVTRRGGRAATGLSKSDFHLFEDSVPQEIRYFSTRSAAPVSLAFLLDLSGSMRARNKLEDARTTIRGIVQSLRADDPVGLIGFAGDRVDWITTFTTDRATFDERLAVQHGFGRTALYDAVAAAPALVEAGTTGRKAILLLTDGLDNASTMNLFRALQLARRVEVPIYTIGFSDMPPGIRPPGTKGTMHQVLQMLSGETGGALFTVHTGKELRHASQRIQDELRTGYVIGYFPTRNDWDGSFRRVRLEAIPGGIDVRTRRGYYALP